MSVGARLISRIAEPIRPSSRAALRHEAQSKSIRAQINLRGVLGLIAESSHLQQVEVVIRSADPFSTCHSAGRARAHRIGPTDRAF
ncbi:hypothetical protein AZH51_06520 [Branchiibius sp. NY16-3462-2]|nr:hypothetical protein AZH51_06520 [Branchiibius sp. NY16-3462-2]